MAINNTVNGGLLQTPKKSAAPIPWNAISVKPVQKPTQTVTPESTISQQRNASSGTISPVQQSNFQTPSGATVNTATGGLVTAPTQQNTFSQPVKGLFGNVAQSLANTSLQGSPQLQGITGALQTVSNQPNQAYTEGLKKYGDISQQIADIGQQGAKAQAGYMTTGTTPVAEGNAAVIAQTQAAQQAALGAQQQAALTQAGLGQSQQQLQQSGLTSAGGLAQQGQGLTQSGLQAAGSLAQPSGTFPFVFDPSTGSFTNAGGGVVTPQQAAQAVLSGQMTYQQAQQALGYLGQVGDSQLQQSILGAGGNPLQLQVQGTGQQEVLQQIPQLEAANVAAEGVKNKINSYLSANPQLNQNALAAANLAQQWLQGKQLTDPKYQTLFNYLNEYTNTLAPILGVGGNVTNLKTEIAQGFINAAASGESIAQVLDSMSRLSTGKIQDLKSGATGGSVVSPSGSNQITTQAADGNSYGFSQDANGVWHAN